MGVSYILHHKKSVGVHIGTIYRWYMGVTWGLYKKPICILHGCHIGFFYKGSIIGLHIIGSQ